LYDKYAQLLTRYPSKQNKDDVASPPKKKAKLSGSPKENKPKPTEKSDTMEIEKNFNHNTNERDKDTDNTKITPTKKAYIKKKVTPTKSPKEGAKTPSSGEKKLKLEPKTPIVELDDDIEEVSPPVNSRKSKSPIQKETPKTEEKKVEHKSPTAPKEANEAKKPILARSRSNYVQFMNKPTPPNKGAKEVPQGQPNCLAGKVFIITGVLDSLEREEAEALIVQYGGSIVKSVAKKTTHALVGIEPGQSKIKKIEELNVPIIDEDGLFAMLRDLPAGKASHVTPKKSPKKPSLPVTPAPVKSEGVKTVARGPTELWTDKYKPQGVKDLVANPGPIAQLTEWLKGWEWERRKERTEGDGKKKAAGAPKAVLISGPPGIGKTTAAMLVARSLGFEPIVTNASDTRNKGSLAPLLEGSATSKSITQFFGSKDKKPAQNQHKTLLIMDEIDGMSSGDRGGIAEVIRAIHTTKIPFICVCNDRYSQKLKSLANHCLDLRFRRYVL
jgi:replication factor C subunit 1